ncbi:MAG: hypothetical protein WC732_05760 [Candidatus Omnitrophota bacterium]
MSVTASAVFYPLAAFGSGLSLWARNLIPVVALYGVNVFALRILQLSLRFANPVPQGRLGMFLAVFLGIEALAVIIVGAFVSLLVIHFLKAGQSQRPVFTDVVENARRQFKSYLGSVVLLVAFFVVGIFLSSAFLTAGHFFYAFHPGTRFGLGILLAASTIAVASAIALVWYGFYFTLSPLVAAFEGKPLVESFRESRSLIRGNAVRYGFLFVMFLAMYMVLGVAVYFVLKSGPVSPRALYAIDPAMGGLFGPLWLSLWLVSYQRLAAAKAVRKV